MAAIGFPLQQTFRSAWVTNPQPIVYQKGLSNLGYQGITDNSMGILNFGNKKRKMKKMKKKSIKKSKMRKMKQKGKKM